MNSIARGAHWISKNPDVLFVAGVIAILFVIFVPMPPALLDFLLVGSLTLSVLVLGTVVYVREPAKFSVFPSVLLLSTAMRVALNIATTRLILGHAGTDGTAAAGQVVKSFGEFVAGNQPLVGFVIFLILVIVNFIVITKGAGRISEVAARFTLDALPGRQMAIDSDLNAGIIKEDEARRRRAEVGRQADFYGAMDGATKFIRGDAIAAILITGINLIVGFLIGTLQQGMAPAQAVQTFTILTIGEGLVAQIPSLIVSLAAGLLVTRAASDTSLSRDFFAQILGDARAVGAAAIFLLLLVPTGLPAVPLLAGAGLLGWVSLTLARGKRLAEAVAAAPVKAGPRPPEPLEPLLHVEPVEIEIGLGLIRHTEKLVERIDGLRRELAAELGIVVPSVRIRDGASLEPSVYEIKIRGTAVMRARAAAGGQGGDIIAHLKDTLRTHAAEILTRDDVSLLVKTLKEKRPAVVDEVVPALMKAGDVQKILQNLLREGVSIRDLGTILETLGDYAPKTKDPEVLTEYVRQSLARTLCHPYLDGEGRLYVITLDPRLEDLIHGGTQHTDRGSVLALPAAEAQKIADRIAKEVDRLAEAGHGPVILCSPVVRAQVTKVGELIRPGIRVLSYNEVLKDVRVESLGMVAAE